MDAVRKTGAHQKPNPNTGQSPPSAPKEVVPSLLAQSAQSVESIENSSSAEPYWSDAGNEDLAGSREADDSGDDGNAISPSRHNGQASNSSRVNGQSRLWQALSGKAGLPGATLQRLKHELLDPNDPLIAGLVNWLADRGFTFDEACFADLARTGKLGAKDQRVALAKIAERHLKSIVERVTVPALSVGRSNFHLDADRAAAIETLADCLVDAEGRVDPAVVALLSNHLESNHDLRLLLAPSQFRQIRARLDMMLSGEQQLLVRIGRIAQLKPIHKDAMTLLSGDIPRLLLDGAQAAPTPREVATAVIRSLFHVIRQSAVLGSCQINAWAIRQHTNSPGAYLHELEQVFRNGGIATQDTSGVDGRSPVCNKPATNFVLREKFEITDSVSLGAPKVGSLRRLSLDVLLSSRELGRCFDLLKIPANSRAEALREAIEALPVATDSSAKSGGLHRAGTLNDILLQLALRKHRLRAGAWKQLEHIRTREAEWKATREKRAGQGLTGGEDLDRLSSWIDKAKAAWRGTNGAKCDTAFRRIERELENLTEVFSAGSTSRLANGWSMTLSAAANATFIGLLCGSASWSLDAFWRGKNFVNTPHYDPPLFGKLKYAAVEIIRQRCYYRPHVHIDDMSLAYGGERGQQLFIKLSPTDSRGVAIRSADQFQAVLVSLLAEVWTKLVLNAAGLSAKLLGKMRSDLLAYVAGPAFLKACTAAMRYGTDTDSLPWATSTCRKLPADGSQTMHPDLPTGDEVAESGASAGGGSPSHAESIRREVPLHMQHRTFPNARSLLLGFVQFSLTMRRQEGAGKPDRKASAHTGDHAFNWLPFHPSASGLCRLGADAFPAAQEKWIKKNMIGPGQALLQTYRTAPALHDLAEALVKALPGEAQPAALREQLRKLQSSAAATGKGYRLGDLGAAILQAAERVPEHERREFLERARRTLDSYAAFRTARVVVADGNWSMEGPISRSSEPVYLGIGFDLLIGQVSVLHLREAVRQVPGSAPIMEYPLWRLSYFHGDTNWWFPATEPSAPLSDS
jgi:hypothetical protein